jgi:hypothetical protein
MRCGQEYITHHKFAATAGLTRNQNMGLIIPISNSNFRIKPGREILLGITSLHPLNIIAGAIILIS